MKELSETEVQHVSGAGFISDAITGFINDKLDAPARNTGDAIGSFIGNTLQSGVHGVANAIGGVWHGVTSLVGGIFKSH
ncbi:hypothetical protein [uncultured Pluralibacter sp.]|uniref:hypothetical protein n=1 Tax=uncultured Pluralibacter sp. TaxID=1490864 RepID=UPI00261834EE|nr:hypothetical protein [uncultured Pluralibacter sp.]